MSRLAEYIGRQFGNPNGFVGRICCLIMNAINKPMYIKTVSLLNLSNDDNVLDIGYGNGYLLKLIYNKKKVNLYGIDISEDMKEQAVRRNKEAQTDGRLFLNVGDCCDLDYNDNYFQAITSINTIYFWRDTIKGLSEIYRTLNKGAVFYNVVYSKEWLDKLSYTQKGFKKYTPEQFVEFGKQVGFENVVFSEIVKGKSFAMLYIK